MVRFPVVVISFVIALTNGSGFNATTKLTQPQRQTDTRNLNDVKQRSDGWRGKFSIKAKAWPS
jgi:hypothetical protein